MDTRLPIDSNTWSKLVGGNDVLSLLNSLNHDDPTPEDVAKIISRVDGGEYMEHAFYYLVPYLLDLFEKHPFKLRSTLYDFSRGIIHLHSENPPDQCKAQVYASRERIVGVLSKAMQFENSVESIQTHLGAIAHFSANQIWGEK